MTNKNIQPKPFKSLFHIIAFILLFFVEQIPLSILVVTKADLGKNFESYIKIAPMISIVLMIITATILIIVFKKSQKFTTEPFTSKTWLTIIIGIVLALAINYMTVPFMKGQNSNVDALQTLGQNSQALLIFSVLIFSPIFEEILFRGILMNWFFANKPIISILLSGIIFGIAHAPISQSTDWIYALSKILLGVLLAAIYYRTKNIKADMTVHFLNNFLSIALGI